MDRSKLEKCNDIFTKMVPSTLLHGNYYLNGSHRNNSNKDNYYVSYCDLDVMHKLLNRAAILDTETSQNRMSSMGMSNNHTVNNLALNSSSSTHVATAASSRRDRSNSFTTSSRCRSNSFPTTSSTTARDTINSQHCTHLERLLLTQDEESGYTALHAAIYRRSLQMTLLILHHVATAATDSSEASSLVSGSNTAPKFFHPMVLLQQLQHHHSQSTFAASPLATESNHHSSLLDAMLSIRDYENFTPLDLLSQISTSYLMNCRLSLDPWKNNRDFKNRQLLLLGSFEESEKDDSDEEHYHHPSSSRRRLRTLSFSQSNRRRSRGASFGGTIHDFDSDEDVGMAAANVDLEELTSDFTILNNNDGLSSSSSDRYDDGRLDTTNKYYSTQENMDANLFDYGCEVMTFGRADSCALGVPHYASRRVHKSSFDGSNSVGINSPQSNKMATSVRPRRVEAFALGEIGRQCCHSSSDEGVAEAPIIATPAAIATSTQDSSPSKNSGPAIAVAAASHHTLVLTKYGHLYSFGLGKSGRLGTGDENHRPLPTRILGSLTKRRVSSIAAALNHSLCCTKDDGAVYAWGSNRFGQLGRAIVNSSGGNDTNIKCLPKRVEELKNVFVVIVAAGDSHSLALSRRGEVFAWGDNRSGQLGTSHKCSNSSGNGTPGQNGNTSISSSSNTHTSNNSSHHKPKRVESLWSTSPHRRITIRIAAAAYSSLALTLPSPLGVDSSPATMGSSGYTLASAGVMAINVVYGWGHGCPQPMRVAFPSIVDKDSKPKHSSHMTLGTTRPHSRVMVNPVEIACAKYHNAAITSDGWVYTWGLHQESLGTTAVASSPTQNNIKAAAAGEWECSTPTKKNFSSSSGSSSHILASPQLVTSLLPQHNQQTTIAIAISASETHTAIVTSCGRLYTWGATHDNTSNALGHVNVKYQPIPKRVMGVQGVVGVAAAREHTVLLVGTAFPKISDYFGRHHQINHSPNCPNLVSSLQSLTGGGIAKHVDLFNVIPLLIMAERIHQQDLQSYCRSFIQMNFDSVLALGKHADFELYHRESLMIVSNNASFSYGNKSEIDDDHRDERMHPLLVKMANSEHDDNHHYRDRSASMCKQETTLMKDKMNQSSKILSWIDHYAELHDALSPSLYTVTKNKIAHHKSQTTNNTSSKLKMSTKHGNSSIATRTLSSRMNKKVETLRNASSLPLPQKMMHTSQLLSSIIPAKQQTSINENKQQQQQCPKRVNMKTFDNFPEKKEIESNRRMYRCEVCKVTCPDESSLELHENGRKHRNRVQHVKIAEETAALEQIQIEKSKQLIGNSAISDTGRKKKMSSAGSASSPWLVGKNVIHHKVAFSVTSTKAESLITQSKYKLSPPSVYPWPLVDEQESKKGVTKAVLLSGSFSSQSTGVGVGVDKKISKPMMIGGLPVSKGRPLQPVLAAPNLTFKEILKEQEKTNKKKVTTIKKTPAEIVVQPLSVSSSTSKIPSPKWMRPAKENIGTTPTTIASLPSPSTTVSLSSYVEKKKHHIKKNTRRGNGTGIAWSSIDESNKANKTISKKPSISATSNNILSNSGGNANILSLSSKVIPSSLLQSFTASSFASVKSTTADNTSRIQTSNAETRCSNTIAGVASTTPTITCSTTRNTINTRSRPYNAASAQKKSFSQIQKEEEEWKKQQQKLIHGNSNNGGNKSSLFSGKRHIKPNTNNSIHDNNYNLDGIGSKWYVHERRERAESLHAIQEREMTQEREQKEWELLMNEQLAIEKEIANENELKKKEEKIRQKQQEKNKERQRLKQQKQIKKKSGINGSKKDNNDTDKSNYHHKSKIVTDGKAPRVKIKNDAVGKIQKKDTKTIQMKKNNRSRNNANNKSNNNIQTSKKGEEKKTVRLNLEQGKSS